MKLAIKGGEPQITKKPNRYNPLGAEEEAAVISVMKTGVLSNFLGAWHENFYGGEKVKEFEKTCAEFFQVKHAVSVNSWTSGLIAAVGAIGIEPGDEVIVTPWTMSASATAIVMWNAIPVFADIDPDTFNLDIESVEKNITERTKAIMAVDIFGHSADMDKLMALAAKYDLKVISDTAQAPGALYKGRYAGTIGHIGGYSLNYHKHIHTGEGGVLVTNDDELAERLRLIRNHGEVVVAGKGESNITNMLGYNFRLGELESAIGIEQLKKLPGIAKTREILGSRLTQGLKGLKGLKTPVVQEDCTHVYYMYPLVLDTKVLGVKRDDIHAALVAEGVGVNKGYQNIHLLPMYQRKIAYGTSGVPWTADFCTRDVDYSKGICPVAESMHDELFLSIGLCNLEYTNDDIDQIILAFEKVWKCLIDE